jgi:phosphomannomutase
VIAAMTAALAGGQSGVVGYEANGGFLTGDPLSMGGRVLPALPTRDAAIVILSVLMLSIEQGVSVSGLLQSLPARFTASDRLKAFPGELSRHRIAALTQGGKEECFGAIEALFGDRFGKVSDLDQTDGLRITFGSEEVVHLRPSGNAPELRCYTEADSDARAVEMTGICMKILEGWRNP